MGSPSGRSPPPVAETLRSAEEGDMSGVSWGGRTGRSGHRRTRQVVACVVGDRSEATGRRLEAHRSFGAAATSVFPQPTHPSGDKLSGQRAPIERWHPTVYQGWARCGRKTLCFCQLLAFHEGVTRWFVPDSDRGLLPSVIS